jgi:hypothetical protein
VRRRAASALLLALSACARQEPIAAEDLAVRVELPTREVESGRAFPLRVVRSWHKDLQPDDWDSSALLPLQLRPTGVARRDDGERVEEVHSFDAYAFGSGRFTVPAVGIRARDRSGAERLAASARINLDVASALMPGAAAAPELPLELLPLPRSRPWLLLGLGAVALLLGGSLWFARRRRQPVAVPTPEPAAPAEVSPPAAAIALARLAELRRAAPDQAQIEAWYATAALVLRDYLEARFLVPAAERTTGELLRAEAITTALTGNDLAMLATVLRQCDLVKFAQHLPDAAARMRFLGAAEQFLAADGANP